jgi:NAD(P) transhydrogenase
MRWSQQEEKTLRDFIHQNQIQIVQGFASLESAFTVRVNAHKESKILSSEYILIATGSRPDRPVNIPFDGWRVIDSDDVFNLETIPKSMVIYGAGVVGCEYACIFASMGVDVTLIDGRTQILQYCDQEIVRELQTYMEAIGIHFKLGTRISHLHVEGPHVSVVFGEQQVQCDIMLWSGRRLPMTEHIGLEKLGIGVDKYRAVLVNENFQTSVSNIYAAGDVIGIPALAATASQQGRFISCHAFGMTLGSFPKDYPIGIYTIPECSMVGKQKRLLYERVVSIGRSGSL